MSEVGVLLFAVLALRRVSDLGLEQAVGRPKASSDYCLQSLVLDWVLGIFFRVDFNPRALQDVFVLFDEVPRVVLQ